MLSVLDSLGRASDTRRDTLEAVLTRGGRTPGDDALGAAPLFIAPAPGLGMGAPIETPAAPPDSNRAATPGRAAPPDRAVLAGLSETDRAGVLELAVQRARAARSAAEVAASGDEWDAKQEDRYRVEIYKKNSIALACLVFVLVGVPLGLSVSRAGVGLVASLAVFVFLFYWITLVQGEKLADRELLPAWLGMWAANAIIGVLGAYLFAREALDPALPDPVRALAGRFSRRD